MPNNLDGVMMKIMTVLRKLHQYINYKMLLPVCLIRPINTLPNEYAILL